MLFLTLRVLILHCAAPLLSQIDSELGYSCSMLDPQAVLDALPGRSANILAYLDFARGISKLHTYLWFWSFVMLTRMRLAVLALLAVVVMVTRYKANGGRLLKNIGRDGSIYYIAASGIARFHSIRL